MLSVWQRLPIVVRAVIAGSVVCSVGTVVWGGVAGYPLLAGWNLRVLVTVPWAIVPMSVFLWLFVKYLGGWAWPSSTADARRASLRANKLSADVWGLSIIAGLVGLAALLPFQRVMSRLVMIPPEAQPITAPPEMPLLTLVVLLVMAAVVAGVVEESAFRGYMQGPIERRYGPIAAIVITGVVFGLAHYNHHPTAVVSMLPYYVVVSAVYGGLAYATNSILPGMVLHAVGNVFSLSRLWATGLSELQVSATAPRLIWETGLDGSFLRSVVVFTVLASLSVWLFANLRKVTFHRGAVQNSA